MGVADWVTRFGDSLAPWFWVISQWTCRKNASQIYSGATHGLTFWMVRRSNKEETTIGWLFLQAKECPMYFLCGLLGGIPISMFRGTGGVPTFRGMLYLFGGEPFRFWWTISCVEGSSDFFSGGKITRSFREHSELQFSHHWSLPMFFFVPREWADTRGDTLQLQSLVTLTQWKVVSNFFPPKWDPNPKKKRSRREPLFLEWKKQHQQLFVEEFGVWSVC